MNLLVHITQPQQPFVPGQCGTTSILFCPSIKLDHRITIDLRYITGPFTKWPLGTIMTLECNDEYSSDP